MSLKVVARSDDAVVLTDEDDGPGAIVYRDGDAGVFHIQTALARGYWEPGEDEPPLLPVAAVNDLRAFNARWRATQAARANLASE